MLAPLFLHYIDQQEEKVWFIASMQKHWRWLVFWEF